jgi:hypothetical protein
MELPLRFYPRCIIGCNSKQRLVRIPVAFARIPVCLASEFWVFAKPLVRELAPTRETWRAILRRWRQEKDLVVKVTAPAWGADPEISCMCIRAIDMFKAVDIACTEFGVAHDASFSASLLYAELSVALSTAVVPEEEVVVAVSALTTLGSTLAANGVPNPLITRCFLEVSSALERLDAIEAAGVVSPGRAK